MKRRVAGLTLAELLLAVAITTLIGLAVAGASVALSNGNANAESYSQSIQMSRIALLNVAQTASSSVLIAGCDATRLVLWRGDTNANGQINMTEVAFISYDATSRELRQYVVKFPDTWSAAWLLAADCTFPLQNLVAVDAVDAWFRGYWAEKVTVLATDVASVKFTPSPAAPLSRRVTIEMTIGSGAQASTLRCSASPRGNWASHVYLSGGQYHLDTE